MVGSSVASKVITRLPSGSTSSLWPEKPSPKLRVVPTWALRPGRTRHTQRSRVVSSSKRTSIRAPVGRTPYRRAGITLVSFRTKRSPCAR
ncbi:hypothetical protein D3C86_1153610 [compost metagenome]